ncbi:hypothetical protein J4414_02995 [Candidatus Woesearchaeota archaeon]|nr:hypothetical protein [Candidatus Woesearchaeota archaeon]
MPSRISIRKLEGVLRALGMDYLKGGKEWKVLYKEKVITSISIHPGRGDEAVHEKGLTNIFAGKLISDGFDPNKREFSDKLKELKKKFR